MEVLDYLIECGVDVSDLKHQIVKEIIYRGQLDILKFLVVNKITIRHTYRNNNSQLIFVIEKPNEQILKFLMDCGININIVDSKIEVPDLIININDKELLNILIPKYINVDMVDENGYTPLVYAVDSQNQSLMKYLLDNGADINLSNKIIEVIRLIIEQNKIDLLNYLVSNDLNVNMKDSNGNTLLVYAIQLKNETFINYLMECGSNDEQGNSILYYSIKYGNETVFKHLIDSGADTQNIEIEIMNGLKNYHNLNILKILIANHFDINREDESGKTLLSYAIQKEDETKVKDLINCGAYIRNVDREINNVLKYCHNINILKLLKNNNFDIDMRDRYGKTLLIHAIQENDLQMVKNLINCDVNVNKEDNYGNTPLDVAIESENVDIVGCLIDNGAFKNAENEYGDTPLIHAIKLGNDRMVKCLIEWGTYISDKEILKNINKEYNYDENKYAYSEINELLNNFRRKY
ncbi:hypothetical protein PIROE2DRAFT_63981 [Piromyces sp. E2]|nr:hypothetical protein PIROE2DRAFT_63981 [Piromyces sp. E2]|eukprot:OUM59098.1 hypothetical protein PIROE2DRAFT_63981 [Piromyces sp. E2]